MAINDSLLEQAPSLDIRAQFYSWTKLNSSIITSSLKRLKSHDLHNSLSAKHKIKAPGRTLSVSDCTLNT